MYGVHQKSNAHEMGIAKTKGSSNQGIRASISQLGWLLSYLALVGPGRAAECPGTSPVMPCDECVFFASFDSDVEVLYSC